MATFVTLINFTDQGIRNVRESPDRYLAFKAMAENLGVTVKCFYYTAGQYDMVMVAEGSDEAGMAATLKAASLGNTRTQTLRAFSVDEMKAIIARMP